MTAYMDKAELRTLLEQLETLARIDPRRAVDIGRGRSLTPEQAFSTLETMSSPNGPVISVADGGSGTSRLNPEFDWDGPKEQVSFELGEGSLNEHIADIRRLIDNWDK